MWNKILEILKNILRGWTILGMKNLLEKEGFKVLTLKEFDDLNKKETVKKTKKDQGEVLKND